MDNLPFEMLSRVASHLPFEDVYSFIRTSDIIHGKLSQYPSTLPKPPVDVTVKCLDANVIKLSVISNRFLPRKETKRHWRVTREVLLTDRSVDSADEMSQEQQSDEVASFYNGFKVLLTDRSADAAHRIKDVQNGDWDKLGDYENRTFPMGRFEGLTLHWNAIQKVAHIKCLKLESKRFDDDVSEHLARLISLCPARIDSVRFDSIETQAHLDLITACKPSFLYVRDNHNKELYNLTAVHKLDWLKDESGFMTLPNFCALTAENMEFNGNMDITIDDVREFIKQWLQSEREIDEIMLGVNVSSGQCYDMIRDELDVIIVNFSVNCNKFVGVSSYHWDMRRPSDGKRLTMDLRCYNSYEYEHMTICTSDALCSSDVEYYSDED